MLTLNWIWQDKEITEVDQLPQNTIGFIYLIRNLIHQRIYVGKKYLHRGKKWNNYWGSSEELTKDIKMYGLENKEIGMQHFTREILHPCDTNIRLTYYEVHYQCIYNVLLTNSYNKSISGRYYKGRI